MLAHPRDRCTCNGPRWPLVRPRSPALETAPRCGRRHRPGARAVGRRDHCGAHRSGHPAPSATRAHEPHQQPCARRGHRPTDASARRRPAPWRFAHRRTRSRPAPRRSASRRNYGRMPCESQPSASQGEKMRTILMLATAAALTFVQPVAAQTWRPPPDSERCPSKWGADDQRGSGNHMGPASVLRAARLIETGQVFELGRVLEGTHAATRSTAVRYLHEAHALRRRHRTAAARTRSSSSARSARSARSSTRSAIR